MATVIGMVSSVRKSDKEPAKGEEQGYFVSIEGISALLTKGEPPQEGQTITATFSVLWKKGKMPFHFLKHWKPATFS